MSGLEVRAGSEIVVARGGGGVTYEEARDNALAAANRALDFLCLRGARAMAIRHAGTEDIVWWSEDSHSVIRLLSIPTLTLHVGKVTGEGRDARRPASARVAGERQNFRLSQLTDDLFDSFRNVYLALESILDHVAPQRTTPPLEREGEWFRRALTEAGKIVNLAGHAPKGAADPVEALYDELYLSTRNLVFHAKSTWRRPSRPQVFAKDTASSLGCQERTSAVALSIEGDKANSLRPRSDTRDRVEAPFVRPRL